MRSIHLASGATEELAKLISKYHKLVLHIYTKGDKSIKIIVIAGTAEATSIIDKLLDMNINVLATVTTRLGMESIHNRKGLHIYQGRLTQKNLESLIASSTFFFNDSFFAWPPAGRHPGLKQVLQQTAPILSIHLDERALESDHHAGETGQPTHQVGQ